MRELELFAEICCPFTHLSLRRLVERRLLEHSKVPVLRVRAWPLELVNGEPLDRDLIAEEVAELREQVAPDLFAGFRSDTFPATSIPAMALAARAYEHGPEVGERMSLALRNALFEEERDIADVDVLADIARSVGLPGIRPADLHDAGPVVADWEEGNARGVVGSPHFFVKGTSFFCPMLRIEQVGGHRRIEYDEAGIARFGEACFG